MRATLVLLQLPRAERPHVHRCKDISAKVGKLFHKNIKEMKQKQKNIGTTVMRLVYCSFQCCASNRVPDIHKTMRCLQYFIETAISAARSLVCVTWVFSRSICFLHRNDILTNVMMVTWSCQSSCAASPHKNGYLWLTSDRIVMIDHKDELLAIRPVEEVARVQTLYAGNFWKWSRTKENGQRKRFNDDS